MTAVEWLEKKLDDALCDTDYLTWKLVCQAVKEAKEMEKQHIIDACYFGHLKGWVDDGVENSYAEQYYNETFNK